MAPSPANTITLGPRTLELRGLRMEHVRRGLLEQMTTVTEAIVAGRRTASPAQIEAQIDIVAAAVEDQITRAEFDGLLNKLGPMEGTTLLTAAIPLILTLSGFVTVAPENASGEAASPAS